MLATFTIISRILWACRISVLSGGAGILLFACAVPAQNLLEDLSFDGSPFDAIRFWSGVSAATVLAWAMPIHYGARLTLDDDGWILSKAQRDMLGGNQLNTVIRGLRRRYAGIMSWTPRLLGLAPFIAIAIGIHGVTSNMGASGLAEGQHVLTQSKWLAIGDGIAAVVYLGLTIGRRYWIDWMIANGGGGTLRNMGRVATGGMTILFIVTAYLFPVQFSVFWPRALLVPALFGALVLPLSQVQALTHRTGLPLLALLAAFALSVTAWNEPFHSLRILPRIDSVDGRSDGRLTISNAGDKWMKANHCTGRDCPRPVIVAIDGGASRAAFTAATVIGVFLDQTVIADRAANATGQAVTPGRLIFAISGVSGGAFGAATIQAALADAQQGTRDAAVSPCKTADRTWFGYAYRPDDKNFTWRECLQALTSGDYLSPTITGLAFRDFFAPPHTIEDRAVLLEQSFERHYDFTTHDHDGIMESGATCDGSTTAGLCRRAARPDVFFGAKEHAGGWIPLLVLNATSVRTGRRILSSDLRSMAGAHLFPQAFDLSEAMSSPCPPPQADSTLPICHNAPTLDNAELRLSTAALTSARFPLVSPDGAFTMKASASGDQVVDGGYFENSGLTSALDVARALVGIGLRPIILSIGNDPQSTLEAGLLPPRPSVTPFEPDAANGFFARMFSVVMAPFNALSATRDGHAAEAETLAHDPVYAKDIIYERIRIAKQPDLSVGVGATDYDKIQCQAIWGHTIAMTKVSMSWWLSDLVQADLDAQKCSIENREIMKRLLDELHAR